MSSDTPRADAQPPEAEAEEAPAVVVESPAEQPTPDQSVAAAPAAEAADDPAQHRFECRSCGYVYDPAEGVKKVGIEPGTPFLELDPASFRCPVCRSKMGAFQDIGPRDKPSGFEENLNFGLGVNRLTPGQKNVLIFGGFALAFAFFLSLYSLR
jgi:rubredoxin